MVRQEAVVFSADHCLQLLQLRARQAVQERRHRKAATGEDAVGLVKGSAGSDGPVPERWRLVSDSVSPHAWQTECLQRWVQAGYRGTVKVATGAGKTLFALLAAQHLQNEREPDLRVAIVVPTIPLMHQWRDELASSNLPSSAIGLLGGGHRVDSLSDCRILISVLNSARDRLPDLVRDGRWSGRMLLVVDECHRAAAEQGSRIFDTHPTYTLGLSATPEPDEELSVVPSNEAYNDSVVGRGLGPIVYEFSLSDSLKAGLLTQFEVWHIGLPLYPEEAREHERLSREITELRRDLEPWYRSARSTLSFVAWCQRRATREPGGIAEKFMGLTAQRKRLLYGARARTEVALGILKEECADPGTKAILFHEVLDETERIFLEAHEAGLRVVLEHSELPESLRNESINAFRKGIARVVVSARSLIEGFNVPSADLGIIVASSSSVRQRVQSLGRLLRRKEGNRKARVYVLYVRDTEDEAIYEKRDWEKVLGAERNRYFVWNFVDGDDWKRGLAEVDGPPRAYRPSCYEVDVTTLKRGDEYPARTHGDEVRVDQQGNLRYGDDRLLPAPKELIDAVLEFNPHRRAVVVPCGHVIARTIDNKWVFLGRLLGWSDGRQQGGQEGGTGQPLDVIRAAGRRRIARRLGRDYVYAKGSQEVEARLLQWLEKVEKDNAITIRRILWDGEKTYWVEVGGEKWKFEAQPLQFPEP